MDEDRDRIRVARVKQSSGGLPLTVALLVIAGLVVSVWKPWDASERDDPGAASPGLSLPAAVVPSRVPTPVPMLVPSAAPTAAAQPRPTPHPDAVACISRGGWRIVTVERTAGRESRSWVAVKPVPARSPTDRAIPLIRIVSGVTRAMGYCMPGELSLKTDPADLVARVWRLEGGRARAVDLGTLSRVATPTVDSSDLYLAQGATSIQTSRWAPGQYVFRVSDTTARWEFWFGIDLVRASGPPEP